MEDTVFAQMWWRFTGYEVRDGYIQPTRDASLVPYSPLADFQVLRSGRKERDAPYELLSRLVEQLRFDVDGHLSPESTEAVLGWCTSNGLLGLLLHQVQEVRFAPRWESPRPDPPEAVAAVRAMIEAVQAHPPWSRGAKPELPSPPRDALHLTQRVFRRTSYGSFRFGDEEYPQSVLRDQLEQRGHVAAQEFWSNARPRVMMHRFFTEEWCEEPLSTTWTRFFPRIPETDRETYQYPEPVSEDFWRLYAEPLADFISAAHRLREGVLAAAQLKGPLDPTVESRFPPGTSLINSLVGPAGPALIPSGDGLEQRLVSPSLLGSLAIMAQLDLASDRRIVRCHNAKCRNWVVAFSYQTIYCSSQCRYAAVKRALRRRKKDQVGSTPPSLAGRGACRP